jgi:colicin import membrane protein
MRLSVPLSFLLHAAVIAWSFLHIFYTPPLEATPPLTIEVSMITPSELTALKKGDVNSTELDAKPKEQPPTEMSKQEADKPKPVDGPPPAAEPPPPQEEAKPPEPEPPKVEETKAPEPPKSDPIADKLAALPPEPAPGPTPEELKKAEEEKQAEEQRKADEAKKEEERKKAEEEQKKKEEDLKKAEEKKKADEKKKKEKEKQKKLADAKKKKEEDLKKQKASEADRLAALLDKTPDKRGAPNAAAPPETQTDYTGPTAGAREGNANRLSVREADLLNSRVAQQLKACWRLPGAGGGIETTVVTVSWRLRQDGSLEGEPQLEGAQSNPLYQQAADAAMRAVINCSPFDLPQDKYQFWSKITFDFDPREMMR